MKPLLLVLAFISPSGIARSQSYMHLEYSGTGLHKTIPWFGPHQNSGLGNPLRYTYGFPYGILGYYDPSSTEDAEAVELSGEGLETRVNVIVTF